jgi:hypothetical protein
LENAGLLVATVKPPDIEFSPAPRTRSRLHAGHRISSTLIHYNILSQVAAFDNKNIRASQIPGPIPARIDIPRYSFTPTIGSESATSNRPAVAIGFSSRL